MKADFITRQNLQTLMQARNEPSISIYLPMVRVGPEVRGNSIRLKNALSELESDLKSAGYDAASIEALLAEPKQLLTDTPFWQHQSDGLALFIAPGIFEPFRLPLAFDPLLIRTDRFHIKPLLPLFSDDGRFYILALSQNQVRLLQGTRHSVDELELEYAPQSIADALWYDDPEEQIQHHTTTSGAGGEPAVMHHGQGVNDDEQRQRLRRYFNEVSQGVNRQLQDEAAPLVLAAVDYLHPIYKEVEDSAHLLEDGVMGNPEHMSAAALHDKAWPIVEPLFAEARKEQMTRYQELANADQTSEALDEIVPAAVEGRVDTLFVATGRQRWGSYDPSSHDVRFHDTAENGHEDLLDFAAMQTLSNGGTVYALPPDDVPGKALAAAIYRF